MALTSGTRLGPFEIVAVLGAGGMGEVYRAKDTRLGRDVAIKILPTSICSDTVARQRFEREAKSISALNHPNICVLHDVGCHEGLDYLVMECVEGETLAARLQKGPLPFSELLKTGIEIANALASAHRLGLVHRDLKPSNIMLTKAGAKLMDFGLAKPIVLNPITPASAPAFTGETLTSNQSPGSPLTGVGAIIGTIQYMAPEQLEGKEADARSDIFAFGAVLYEMATGRRAFEGKSYLSVASAILHKDPVPLAAIQPDSPPPLNYVISTCLAKDPEDRFQTAHDVKLQLAWLSQSSGIALPAPPVQSHAHRPSGTIFGLAAAAFLVVLVLGLLFFKYANRPAISDFGVVRFSVALPPKQELAADLTQAVAISPDGKRLAYVAAESGVAHLYVRRLDQLEPVAIPDSEGANFPFFSPNGDWVVFFSQGKLKKASSDGGRPVALCDLPAFFGGVWTPHDLIVVSIPNLGLATVPSGGGPPRQVAVANNKPIYPQGLTWLAGGDWVAFTDYSYSQHRQSVFAMKLSSGELRTLLDNAQSPSYSAGNLVYYQGGALWAVPFDSEKLQLLGTPVEIETGVDEVNYVPQASVSRTGALAFAPGPAEDSFRNLFLVNRQGAEQKLVLPPNDYIDPAFSPDGKRIAFVIRSVQQLGVLERDRGALTSLAPNLQNFAPTWASDGKSLLMDAIDASRQRGFYRVAADGSSEPQLLRPTPQTSHITSIAGDIAAVMVSDPVTNTDLWLLSLQPPYELRPFKRTAAVERQGALSPNGRWMAYSSNESGRSEIYVEPVPGPGGRRQISSDGGSQPRWVRNGHEIIYRNGTKMMSVPVQLQPTFLPGKVVELFDRKFDPGAAVAGYDVSADGQTFVMTRSERENPTEIRVILGWPSIARPQK
jgi:serine/threonine protein kinase/Tol biopolymer transport system component